MLKANIFIPNFIGRFFQGHDTTAMSISWTLYMLGLHESIQDKVREEIDSVVGFDDVVDAQPVDDQTGHNLAKRLIVTDITSEHMRDMRYLDRVIKESLRMWPSIPFVARQMTEDLTVGKLSDWPILQLTPEQQININWRNAD
jgi:cytochrome P450